MVLKSLLVLQCEDKVNMYVRRLCLWHVYVVVQHFFQEQNLLHCACVHQLLLLLTILPAFEEILSQGTEEDGVERYRRVTL